MLTETGCIVDLMAVVELVQETLILNSTATINIINREEDQSFHADLMVAKDFKIEEMVTDVDLKAADLCNHSQVSTSSPFI